MYPDKNPKEREDAITEEYGAVFIIGIGADLSNGEPMMGVLRLRRLDYHERRGYQA